MDQVYLPVVLCVLAWSYVGEDADRVLYINIIHPITRITYNVNTNAATSDAESPDADGDVDTDTDNAAAGPESV